MQSQTSTVSVDPNLTVSDTSSNGMSEIFTKTKDKVKHLLKQDRAYATVLVSLLVIVAIFVFSHEKLYELTNQYIGETVNKDGIPTTKGLVTHSILGGAVVGLLVYFGFTQVVGTWRNKLQ